MKTHKIFLAFLCLIPCFSSAIIFKYDRAGNLDYICPFDEEEAYSLRKSNNAQPQDVIIKISRNPNRGLFSVSFSITNGEDECQYKISSIDGNILYNGIAKNNETYQIDISNAQRGVYIIYASTSTSTSFKRFIKE